MDAATARAKSFLVTVVTEHLSGWLVKRKILYEPQVFHHEQAVKKRKLGRIPFDVS